MCRWMVSPLPAPLRFYLMRVHWEGRHHVWCLKMLHLIRGLHTKWWDAVDTGRSLTRVCLVSMKPKYISQTFLHVIKQIMDMQSFQRDVKVKASFTWFYRVEGKGQGLFFLYTYLFFILSYSSSIHSAWNLLRGKQQPDKGSKHILNKAQQQQHSPQMFSQDLCNLHNPKSILICTGRSRHC